MVLAAEQDKNRVGVHVHPNRPDAWKKEPHYSALKELARSLAPQQGVVVVCIGRRTHVVFPDRDVDLGILDDDHRIICGERKTPFGTQQEARKVHKDDPRVQQRS